MSKTSAPSVKWEVRLNGFNLATRETIKESLLSATDSDGCDTEFTKTDAIRYLKDFANKAKLPLYTAGENGSKWTSFTLTPCEGHPGISYTAWVVPA